MADALRRFGIDFEEIDVDSDPRLDELYGADVPVLFLGEDELCRHRLTPEAIGQLKDA
jgi:glutaredoxin